MTFALGSAIAGGSVSGFTSPTYTHTLDLAPTVAGKQYARTAIGGTQAGVSVNSISKPATINFVRPLIYNGPPVLSNGVLRDQKWNKFKIVQRFGLVTVTGGNPVIGTCTVMWDLPAGADLADPASLKAAISELVGVLSNQSSGIADTLLTGNV